MGKLKNWKEPVLKQRGLGAVGDVLGLFGLKRGAENWKHLPGGTGETGESVEDYEAAGKDVHVVHFSAGS